MTVGRRNEQVSLDHDMISSAFSAPGDLKPSQHMNVMARRETLVAHLSERSQDYGLWRRDPILAQWPRCNCVVAHKSSCIVDCLDENIRSCSNDFLLSICHHACP